MLVYGQHQEIVPRRFDSIGAYSNVIKHSFNSTAPLLGITQHVIISVDGLRVEDVEEPGFIISDAIPLTREVTGEFLSFSATWEATQSEGVEILISHSIDSANWSDWMALLPSLHSDSEVDSGNVERRYSELVFLNKEVTHLRYKVQLNGLSTQLRKIELNLFDPGIAPEPDETSDLVMACPCPSLSYITRAGWNCPEGETSGWTPQTTSVTHLVIHHQAGTANPPYASVVLSIWNQHAITQGWGDIGYNWLIAPDGTLYKGRAWSGSNDNVVAAHMCACNNNKMGVCMLGNFTSTSPTSSAYDKLKQLLAWKSCSWGISVTGSGTVSYNPNNAGCTNGTLNNLIGHRDGCSPSYTECPGNTLYQQIPQLKSDVVSFINSCGSSAVPSISLSAPSASASNVSCPVDFSWSSTPSSNIEYRIQVSTSSSGFTTTNGFTSSTSCNSTVVVNMNTGSTASFAWNAVTTGVCAAPLASTTYYWTVRVYDTVTGQTSDYAPVRSFTTSSSCGGSSVSCSNDAPCNYMSLSINTSGTCSASSCSTVGATGPSPDIPYSGSTTCASNYQSGRYDDDVWFRITPSSTNPVTIRVTPTSNTTNFDPAVGLYSGSCSSLTQIGCADSFGAGTTENLIFTPSSGTSYYIRVFSYGIGSTFSGNFQICAFSSGGGGGSTPPNDLCSGATLVSCGNTYSGTTVGATLSGAPSTCGTSVNTSGGVWYRFSGNGQSVTVSTCTGTSFDSKIGVYSGSCGSLNCISGNDDDCDVQSTVTFTSASGVNYYIYVTGYDTESGPFVLTVSCNSSVGDDIYLTNATATPTAVQAGGIVDVTVDQNYSGSQLDADLPSFDLDYYLSTNCSLDGSDYLFPVSDISAIGSDDPVQSESASLTILPTTAPGTYYILFVGDADGELTEANESNNVVCIQITVLPPPAEDVWITNATATPTSIQAGSAVDVTADQNYSGIVLDADLPSIDLDYYLSSDCILDPNDYLFPTSDISGIGSDDPSESESATLTIPLATATGTYYILFVGDADGEVIENDETNNIVCIQINVTGCSVQLATNTMNHPASNGSGSINTIGTANCPWVASESCSWITLQTTSGITGDALTYLFDVNNGPARTCQILFNGQLLTISQDDCTPPNMLLDGPSVVCSGASFQLTANGCSSCTYAWSNGMTGQTINLSLNSTTNMEVIATGSCGTSSASNTISVTQQPALPGQIIGNQILCAPGNSETYSITPVSGATSYTWNYPNGGTQTGPDPFVTFMASTSGTVTVSANNSCGAGPAQSLSINVVASPSQPGLINGDPLVCAGSSPTFSIAPVSDATSYSWSYTGGGAPSGSGISVTFNPTSDGVLSVSAMNGCGISTAQVLSLSMTAAPAQPDAISGTANTCTGVAQTYSITPVSGASFYTWSYSGGGSPVGTGTSVSLTPTGSGTLTVSAGNNCGNSAVQSIAIDAVSGPAQPIISGSATFCPGGSTLISANSPNCTDCTYGWSTGESGSELNVNTAGTLTATATNSCGSTASQQFTISQALPPAQPLISGTNAFCQGGSTTLTANSNNCNGCTYTWSNGAIGNTATVNTGGVITVVAANTCGSSTSLPFNVSVFTPQSPTITQNGGDLIASSGLAYQWFDSNGPISSATSQTLTPTANGLYSVQVTDALGCVTMSDAFPFFSIGIKDISNEAFVLSPNPAYTTLTITPLSVIPQSIALYSVTGQKLRELPYSSAIDISDFAIGTYFIELRTQKGSVFLKWVKA